MTLIKQSIGGGVETDRLTSTLFLLKVLQALKNRFKSASKSLFKVMGYLLNNISGA